MTTYTAYHAVNNAGEKVVVVRGLPEGSKSAVTGQAAAEDIARKLVHDTTGEDLTDIVIDIIKPTRH